MDSVRRSDDVEVAYEALAPLYDDFTAHHDYELWLGHLLPELERHGLCGGDGHLLDVACGTGKSFIPMLNRGWTVTGCDISAAMLAVAGTKVGSAADLRVADMRDLPRIGSFDLVWCVADALNYLADAEELEAAFRGMGNNLGRRGLLAFDLNTLHSFRTFFAEKAVVESDGLRMTWRGLGSPATSPGGIGEALLEVERLEGSSTSPIPASRHRERHFPEAEVLTRLRRAGLECLDVFGHHYDAIFQQPLDEDRHTKAVYVARPAAAAPDPKSST
jgi:SAM-dependent methyltransferase